MIRNMIMRRLGLQKLEKYLNRCMNPVHWL
jgi:hypothetical protein